jgi:hypothetical protein
MGYRREPDSDSPVVFDKRARFPPVSRNLKDRSMTTFVISLIFGFAAFVAVAVVRASLAAGLHRARQIAAECSAIEAAANLQFSPTPRYPAFRPHRAVA